MLKQYRKEELWKLFEKLPQELKEAVFSQETADHIFNICDRNNIEEMPKVAYYVGLVLMGTLLPTDFQKTIEEELKIEESVAKSIATEINRFIFYPVRPALEQLHSMEMGQTQTEKPAEANTVPQAGKEDAYKESIE